MLVTGAMIHETARCRARTGTGMADDLRPRNAAGPSAFGGRHSRQESFWSRPVSNVDEPNQLAMLELATILAGTARVTARAGMLHDGFRLESATISTR